jgi:alkaline phosphatase D
MKLKNNINKHFTQATVSTIFIISGVLTPLVFPHFFSAQTDVHAQQNNSSNNNNTYLEITHGIASGDVTNDSAIIWSRANQQAQMNVEYDINANFSNPLNTSSTANEANDYTAFVLLNELRPDTMYSYKAWFSAINDSIAVNSSNGNNLTVAPTNFEMGNFKTAPNSNESRPISYIWGGDLGGQKYCRNAEMGGYLIFKSMESLNPDFFVANGDMIYADGTCPVNGPILNNKINNQNTTWRNIPGDFKSISDPSIDWNNISEIRAIYQDHWKYNRNDTYFQDFLKNTSMYSQWDDHEIINDFGSEWPYWNLFNAERAGYPNIVEEGTKTFFNYSPINNNNNNSDSGSESALNQIYRSFNWGKDLDLFIIDARSYRDQNHIADTPYNNKTVLGKVQLEWLKQGLSNSEAIWKVISSNIPISIPTASNASILGRDGWANGNETDNYSYYTGFERELTDLLRFIDEQKIKNVIFVTTDVHFPAYIKYNFDLNKDGNSTHVHEFVSGPLNAVRGGVPFPILDATFNPSLIYGEGTNFNFGHAKIQKIDGKSHFIVEIRDENGIVRPGSVLELISQYQ